MTMSANQVALSYLVASVLFILALKGLSNPLTARRGNRFGIAGMTLAVLTTLAITQRIDLTIGALALGGIIGWLVAQRVQMTQMPELVAAMHSLVGLAAVLIAIAVVMAQWRRMINEEAILKLAFPEYRAYAANTSFLIPTKLSRFFTGSNLP